MYDGLVVDARDGFVIAFDDGEAKHYTHEQLSEMLAAHTFAAADPADEGIIANESGHPTAVGMTYYPVPSGSRGGPAMEKPVGVLVGRSSQLAGETVHLAHYALEGAFDCPDRQGFHTFRRARRLTITLNQSLTLSFTLTLSLTPTLTLTLTLALTLTRTRTRALSLTLTRWAG